MLKATHSTASQQCFIFIALLWTFSVLPFLPGLMENEWASEWERERKRRKTTQKQNEEEKSIFIEKLWDFSCAFYPTTHSLLFVRAYIEKVAVTHTQSHTFLHLIRLSQLSTTFSECHCTSLDVAALISFHSHLCLTTINGLIYYGKVHKVQPDAENKVNFEHSISRRLSQASHSTIDGLFPYIYRVWSWVDLNWLFLIELSSDKNTNNMK